MKRTGLFALFVLFLSAFVLQAPARAAETVIDVTLWNTDDAMGISLDKHFAPAGKVTFRVSNTSRDLEHEMVVIRVDNFHAAIPYKDGGVDEEAMHALGEVSELPPGKSGALTLDLEPGKYLLICNVPGHFEMGMFTHMTVQ